MYRSVLMTKATLALAVLALLGLANASSAQTEVNEPDAQGVQQVITDQLDAFNARDHERAYSHAAPGIKQMFPSIDRFIGMVRSGYEVIYSAQSHTFGRNIDVNGRIHQEVIITGPNGKQWQAVYTLQRQSEGSWKIVGVKLEPYTGAAA